MPSAIRWTVLAALGAIGATVAPLYNSSPPEEMTGAPGEASCHACHDSYPLNQGGSVEILEAPALYRAGATYRLRVRVTSDNTAADAGRRWGFELTAIDAATGDGAGAFATVEGENTGIVPGTGAFASRQYVHQLDAHAGTPSPAEWQVDWTAPDPGDILVEFYASAVAADGGQGNNGDWVYTTSASANDTTTRAHPVSWGSVKARYRR